MSGLPSTQVMHEAILPAPVQAAILRQCPGVSIRELQDALDCYRFAQVLAPTIPLHERKVDLERVARLAEALISAIGDLGTFERSSLNERLRVGNKTGLIQTRQILRNLADTASSQAAKIEPTPGRPLTRKAYLVRDVARELRRCGVAGDASSKGPLVFILTELFRLVDDPPPDVRSLVRSTLAKMDMVTMNFCQGKAP